MVQKDQDSCVVGGSPHEDRLLKVDDVITRLGVSRSTIWRLTQSGDFPRPVAISPGRKGWLKSQVDAWIASRLPPEKIVAKGAGNYEPLGRSPVSSTERSIGVDKLVASLAARGQQ
jgi:prophage regulatory protein